MRASLTVPEPMSWRCCWAWGSPRCSTGAASSLVTVMASIAAKAATAMWLTASARKNANGSCSRATSPNLRRCHQGRSCRYLRIAGSTSVRSAAFIGFCMPMARPTGAVGHGHHRNQDQCHDSGRQGQNRCGAGTSPTCRPPFVECGCTSIS